jgi:biotin carboxyl carrier protein
MSEPITEIRALLMHFRNSGLKDMFIRSKDLAVFMAQPDGAANPMQLTADMERTGADAALVNAPHLGLFEPACAAGDEVSAGQIVAVIDVLGRKTQVASESAGRVAAIHFAANDLVEYGEILLEIEAA